MLLSTEFREERCVTTLKNSCSHNIIIISHVQQGEALFRVWLSLCDEKLS